MRKYRSLPLLRVRRYRPSRQSGTHGSGSRRGRRDRAMGSQPKTARHIWGRTGRIHPFLLVLQEKIAPWPSPYRGRGALPLRRARKTESNPCEAVAFIEDSPTVSPDEVRGVGEWIDDSVASNVFRCSICENDAPVSPTDGTEYKSNYCPSCGARMEETE